MFTKSSDLYAFSSGVMVVSPTLKLQTCYYTLSQSFELTDIDIHSSDFNLLKSYFKSAMLARVELNFAWYSRVSAITTSLLIFLRAALVSDMI